MSAEIRPLGPGDLDAVARVHVAAFPDSLMTKFGRRVVRRYYLWQMEGPHDAHCIGAFADDRLTGFCFGGRFHGATGGFIRQNAGLMSRELLRRPWLAVALVRRLGLTRALQLGHYVGKSVGRPAPVETGRSSFGILSIAVDPGRQGEGIGNELMRVAEREAVTRGHPGMHLTVNPGNEGAIRFYERLGWERSGDAPGWSGRMVKSLRSDR